jgi:hypothetical protein
MDKSVLQVCRDLLVRLEVQDPWVLREIQDNEVRLDLEDLQVCKETRGQRARPDPLDLQGARAQLVRLETQAKMEHREEQEHLETKVLRG